MRYWWAAGLSIAGLVAAAAIGASWWSGPGAMLVVTSEPAGAELFVDGRATGQSTPAEVFGLNPGARVQVELRLAGHRPWRQTVEIVEDVPTRIDAVLAPVGQRAARNVQPPHADAGSEDEPEVIELEDHESVTVVISAQRHAFDVRRTTAVRVELDPRKRYRIWTSGAVHLDTVLGTWTEAAMYWLEGPGLPAAASFGLVDRNPRDVQGAAALHAFVVDPAPHDNAGSLELSLAAGDERRSVRIDGRANAVWPDGKRVLMVAGLWPEERYEISVRSFTARTRGDGGGELDRVLVARLTDAPPEEELEPTWARESQLVPAVGRSVVVGGAHLLALTIPDGPLDDNAGELHVEVRAQTGSVEEDGGDSEPEDEEASADDEPGRAWEDATEALAEARSRAAEAPRSKRASVLYDEAIVLFKNRHHAEARLLLDECIQVDPLYAACHKLLGSTYAMLRQPELGYKHYRRFLELAPDDPSASKVERMLDQFDDARGRPTSHVMAEKLLIEGRRYETEGRIVEAMQTYQMCLATHRHPRCHLALGLLLRSQGRIADARNHLEAWLVREPDDPQAAEVRAWVVTVR